MYANEQRTIAAPNVLRWAHTAAFLCHPLYEIRYTRSAIRSYRKVLAAGADCRGMPASTRLSLGDLRLGKLCCRNRSIWQGGFGDPLGCTGACTSLSSPLVQIVREALTKDFAAMLENDQPYERALYSTSQLLEARKWHVSQYLAVLPALQPQDLKVCACRWAGIILVNIFYDSERCICEQVLTCEVPVAFPKMVMRLGPAVFQ